MCRKHNDFGGLVAPAVKCCVARALGIDSGLGVIAVAENSPAARAGIRAGDVVLGIEGNSPGLAQEMYRRIRDSAPGTAIALNVWRDKERFDVQVTVEKRPRQPEAP